MARRVLLAIAAALLLGGASAEAQGGRARFDWDGLGLEFCRLTLTNDLRGMGTILSVELLSLIQRAAAASGTDAVAPRRLFQTYSDPVPLCTVRTRSAAIVEVQRSATGGTPAWSDYLVIVPEADGTTRIDDVLFSTRRSDTLRARLTQLAQ